MLSIPKFELFGKGDRSVEGQIQPALIFRKWSDLSDAEKSVAFQEVENTGWVEDYSSEILETIVYLNHEFLRRCPGQHLHAIKPSQDTSRGYSNNSARMQAALLDFEHIFKKEKTDSLVFRMFSKYASCYINRAYYRMASESNTDDERQELIEKAFAKFDWLSNCFNHIFEQFAVNQMLTRSGFVPRQDKKITDEIYTPVLRALSDSKWNGVSTDLEKMFEDYQAEDYPEVITKAHGAVQRFLQIMVGEEGKNGKGEVGLLFKKAKDEGAVPVDRFTEPLINVIQGFIVSERATNSTAKPTLKETTASDALLMMNVVMIFLQHCLQKQK